MYDNTKEVELATNDIKLILKSDSKNESLARVAISAFIAQLDPIVSDIDEIKTAVSEAVTNAIIHGYNGSTEGEIILYASYTGNQIYIEVKDAGIGISDIEEARTPLFTSKPELERSGLGFTVIESFMDKLEIESLIGEGTTVKMYKKLTTPTN